MFGNKNETILVEGMMCEHCAAHVKTALSALEGVNDVKVDLKAKKVTIKAKRELEDAELQAAIEKAGYRYGGRI